MIISKRRRATAIVEIDHQRQRGILVHADGNFWILPGGGAERHEPRLAAAVRELREETGLEAYAAHFLFRHESSKNDHKVFLLRADGQPRIVAPHEAPAFGWCDPVTLKVTPLLVADGVMTDGLKLINSASAIITRYEKLRAQHQALFDGIAASTLSRDGDSLVTQVPHHASVGQSLTPPTAIITPFTLLDRLCFEAHGMPRAIEIYHGDLTALPPQAAVDVLVVSSYPNRYRPTPISLIGALARKGISVEELSRRKALDLRPDLACWLSEPVHATDPGIQFARVLCFEPPVTTSPPEVVGDIFQCLIAVAESGIPVRSIAMPLLAGGIQGVATDEMLLPLFDAATHWIEHGLPIETIRIVAYSATSAAELRGAFGVLRRQYQQRPLVEPPAPKAYDLFVSYCWQNKDAVDAFVAELKRLRPSIRLFLDRQVLKPGCAWQQEIFNALDQCRHIVAFYSPAYLASKVCREEFNIALYRQRDEGGEVLLPVYLQTASLPTVMKMIQYLDCRESDPARLKEIAVQIVAKL